MSLPAVARTIDSLVAAVARVAAWLALAMVLTGVTVVVMRYGFNVVYTWLQETITYMHAAIFMVGAAFNIQTDGHVRVNILHGRLSARARAWVDIVTMAAVVMPFCVLIHWASLDYVLNSWRMQESSPHSGGLPFVYVLKTYIWAFADLLFLAAVARLLHRVAELRAGRFSTRDDASMAEPGV